MVEPEAASTVSPAPRDANAASPMMAVARWTAIAAAAFVLLRAVFVGFDNTANAAVLMAALATIGTLLGRVPQGPGLTFTTGILSLGGFGMTALHGLPRNWASEAAYGVAAVALLASGGVMVRAARSTPAKDE